MRDYVCVTQLDFVVAVHSKGSPNVDIQVPRSGCQEKQK
jgi:hypothetical protein